MAFMWTIFFAMCSLGLSAGDHADLLQVQSVDQWALDVVEDTEDAPKPDSLVAHIKLVDQELGTLLELAKHSSKDVKLEKHSNTKGKKQPHQSPTGIPGMGGMGDIQSNVRIMSKGFDLLVDCMRQVRQDQAALLAMTSSIQERVYEPVVGKEGLDMQAADEGILRAATAPLAKVLEQYYKGFEKMFVNEKPLAKKVEHYYENGRGKPIKAQIKDLISPLTEGALDAQQQTILSPLSNATDALAQVSNASSLKDIKSIFSQISHHFQSAARRTHKQLDRTIALDDSGSVKREFDKAKTTAQLFVGPQIFDKAWSVIKVSMLNAHKQVEIMDNLSALFMIPGKPRKAAAPGAKGKKTGPAPELAAKGKAAAPGAKGKKTGPAPERAARGKKGRR